MSTKYLKPGKTITVTAPATVTSGQTVKVGSLVGIAQADAASGAALELGLEGVYEVVKNSGETWTEGEKVYWDATNSEWTETATSNTLGGYAVEGGAASAATVGYVLLARG